MICHNPLLEHACVNLSFCCAHALFPMVMLVFSGNIGAIGTAGELSVNKFYLTKRNRIAGFDSDAFRPIGLVWFCGFSQERISDTDG